jgi:uncharacterized protein (TIGR03066 family)
MHSTILLAVVSLALAASVFAAPIPKPEKKSTAEKVGGVWKVVSPDYEAKTGLSFTMEFAKDGKLTSRFGNDIAHKYEGTYTVDGDKIEYTFGDGIKTFNVTKLTDDDLIVIKQNDEKLELERVKAK